MLLTITRCYVGCSFFSCVRLVFILMKCLFEVPFYVFQHLFGALGGLCSVIVAFSDYPPNYFLMPIHRIIELFSIHR